MRKLIYSLLAIMAIILTILFVAPYFIGKHVQQLALDNINVFNSTPPYSNYITVTTENYQRHWFSSDAQIKITLHTPAAASTKFNESYTYAATIKHGPLFFIHRNNSSSVHWGAGAIVIDDHSTDFDGAFGALLPWHGQPNLFAHISTFLLHDPAGNTYSFNDILFDTQGSHHTAMQYTLSIAQLNAHIINAASSVAIEMHNIKFAMNGRQIQTVWLGSYDFSAEKLLIGLIAHGAKTPLAVIKNVTFNTGSHLTADKSKIDASFAFNIDSLDAMQKTIKPITLNYSVNGVDVRALQQPTSVQMQANNPTLQTAIQVLQNGFTFKIDKLYLGLPKDLASSPLSAQAELTMKATDGMAKKLNAIIAKAQSDASTVQAQPNNAYIEQALPLVLQELKDVVIAKGQASIPQSFIEQGLLHLYTEQLIKLAAANANVIQTPQELAAQAYTYLTQNKMLIPNNDGSISLAFTFDQGQLLINGNKPAFDIPQPTLPSANTTISTPTGN